MHNEYFYNNPQYAYIGWGIDDNKDQVPAASYHKILKINSNLNINSNFSKLTASMNAPERFIKDANNQSVWGDGGNNQIGSIKTEYVEDNLNVSDLDKKALKNGITFSKQDDGSVIADVNIDYNAWSDTFKKAWESYLPFIEANSYFYNVVQNTPEQQATIIKNNNDAMAKRNYVPSTICPWIYFAPNDRTKPYIITVTDLDTGENSTEAFAPNGSTFNAELYKNVNIRYIDDNTGKTVSSDSMIGIQDKIGQYKVNIPNGYVLSKNQPTSSKYTWSDDKSNINYTFDKDQKLRYFMPGLKLGYRRLIIETVLLHAVIPL